MDLPDILTSPEVASLLRCEPKTIDEKARLGVLPGFKFGVSWVFPKEALLRALNGLAVQEASERSKPVVPAIVVMRQKTTRKPPAAIPTLPFGAVNSRSLEAA